MSEEMGHERVEKGPGRRCALARLISARRSVQTEEQFAQSERQYRLLFETLPRGIISQDAAGRILAMNPAAERILGRSRAQFVGRVLTDEECQALREDGSSFPIAEHPSSVALRSGRQVRDVVMGMYNPCEQAYRWMDVMAVPVFRPGQDRPYQVYTYLDDITDRKLAEQRLRASEQRYRRLFEANLAGTYLTKVDGTILDFNDAMMKMLGYEAREEIFPHRSSDFYADPEFRNELIRLLQKDGIVPGKEAVLRRKDGSILYAFGYAVLLKDEQTGEPYIQGVAIDITERKRTEEALRELTRTLESKVAERTALLQQRAQQLQKLTLELSEAEDRERRRLAEVLHDDLQQVLAAARFHVGILSGRTRGDPEAQDLATQVLDLLKEAIDKSRSLSHELSGPALAHSDLFEVFEWLAQQMRTKHGLHVQLKTCDRIELSSEPLRVLLYKAALELLFNVIKHAHVREAVLRLRHRRGWIYLSVSDRGQGFDPAAPGALGFGLQSIRERVELLGGRLRIRSIPGKGSTFLLVVPDAQAGEAALPEETPSVPGEVSAVAPGQ
jgi:PAS domain S-box-containing protein